MAAAMSTASSMALAEDQDPPITAMQAVEAQPTDAQQPADTPGSSDGDQPADMPALTSTPTLTPTPTATATPSPTSTPTATPTPPVETTLQQTIQKNLDAQVQAIGNQNLSLIADTTTADYGRELAGVLKDMIDTHVTGIKLAKLEWGPIKIAPDSASANVQTVETWQITSTAGSVDDLPARNDYTLVRENGAWKIKADAVNVLFPELTPTPTTR